VGKKNTQRKGGRSLGGGGGGAFQNYNAFEKHLGQKHDGKGRFQERGKKYSGKLHSTKKKKWEKFGFEKVRPLFSGKKY